MVGDRGFSEASVRALRLHYMPLVAKLARTIYTAGPTAKFRSAIRIRSRGNVIAPRNSAAHENSFCLIHEEAILIRRDTMKDAMNSDVITMEISCIVLSTTVFQSRVKDIRRYLYLESSN